MGKTRSSGNQPHETLEERRERLQKLDAYRREELARLEKAEAELRASELKEEKR